MTTLVAVSLLAAQLRAEGPRLTPQAGLLLLRNGHVVQGEITRAGDYYVVTLGPNGEVKLPAADVEAQTRDFAEAYAYKQAGLPVVPTAGAGPHLELAEWCLRHGMLAQSAEQLLAAMRREPDHPRIPVVERRLQLATERDKPTVAATTTIRTVSSDDIEKAVRDLPAGSLEKFAAVVQPLMLNRCGANQCHGPNAKSNLSLLKPAHGQNSNRRFTQRNLYAALQYIDREKPENSPLLTFPSRRHGTAATAVFDEHTKRQFEELLSWVKLTAGQAEPIANARMVQPSTLASAPQDEALHQVPPVPSDAAMSASVPVSTPAPSEAAQGHFVPRDEFDPEIFNRRYLNDK